MKKVGYKFKDRDLLKLALSHRSVGARNNERLEFLGDSLVNFIIASDLYHRFPDATEGQLTRMRAQLVCADMLVVIAKELGIGHDIVLGPGEMRSGGHQRRSILADSLEAIIGAVFLDSGQDLPILRDVVLNWYVGKFDDIRKDHKDPKTVLQEYLQGNKMPLPVYDVTHIEGEQHEQTFHVSCSVEPLTESVEGTGSSRRKAEQVAAKQTLEKLNEK